MYSRRLTRSPRTSAVYRASESVVRSFASRHWYRGDSSTLSAGNLSTLPNMGSAGGQLAVLTGTIAAPAAVSALNGMPCWSTNGTQDLQASHAASEYAYLHSGAGHNTFVVYVPRAVTGNRFLLSTAALATGAETGYVLWQQGTNSVMSEKNGTTTIVSSASSGGLAIGTPMYLESSYKNGASPEYVHRQRSTTIDSGSDSGTPSASAPDGTLRVCGGIAGAGANRVTADIAEIISFDRVLSTAERTALRQYFSGRYSLV